MAVGSPIERRLHQLELRLDEAVRRISNLPARWTPQSDPSVWRDVQINGAVELDDNRWKYGFFEVYLDNDEVWQPVTAGATGDSTGDDYALNASEANNSATGVQGNGVDISNLPANFAIMPIADGRIVPMRYRTKPDGTKRAMIYPGNASDGDCA